jgi:hypothetical protein
MTTETIADVIDRQGQTITLRRLTGTQQIPFDVTVKAVARGYKPTDLIAGSGIVQGDRMVTISSREIDARQWPGPPRRNDKVIIDGFTINVEAVESRQLGEDLAMYVMQVRG